MKSICINDNWNIDTPAGLKSITLPHDAMIHEKRIPSLVGGENSACYPGGKYTYSRRIYAGEVQDYDSVIVEFEGVWQNAGIYVDETLVTTHKNGYTNFFVDLSALVLDRKDHTLKVVADNTRTPNSRWYTGSGIYRDVYLHLAGSTYMKPQELRVTTLNHSQRKIRVDWNLSGDVENINEKYTLSFSISDGEKTIHTHSLDELRQQGELVMDVPGLKCWSDETPILYTLSATLKSRKQGIVVDEITTKFGLRELCWNSEKGFLCNGKNLKLRGACIHHDNGPLGACEYKEAAYRRIRTLKECGYNAIRSAHNPISTHLLNACDELGMYVMDEFSDVWKKTKTEYDYSIYFAEHYEEDISAMVMHDYNHPCVVMYCTGNEIYDINHTEANEIQRKMAEIIRSLDTTRPITNGVNVLAGNKQNNKPIPQSEHHDGEQVDPRRTVGKTGINFSKLMNMVASYLPRMQERVTAKKFMDNLGDFFAPLDMVGLNYGTHMAKEFEKRYPSLLIVHTETYPRRIASTWPVTHKLKNVCGDFMWTGWEYIGETGIGVPQYGGRFFSISKKYPCLISGTGAVNLIGEIQPQGEYAKIAYGLSKNPYIVVHPPAFAGMKVLTGQWQLTDAIHSWSFDGYENIAIRVDVYSNAPFVELLQDERSLGRNKAINNKATFFVPYRNGQLKAIALNTMGKELGKDTLISAKGERSLSVLTERDQISADTGSIAYLKIAMVGENGQLDVSASAELTVHVDGEGVLEAVANGDPMLTTAFDGNVIPLYHGTALIIARSNGNPGEIDVHIMSTDGREARAVINCQ